MADQALAGVPLPFGWVQKFDPTSNKPYFIDHATKTTHWDDPRFSHPSIWTPQRLEEGQRMHGHFPQAPEKRIKTLMLAYNFSMEQVKAALIGYGYPMVGGEQGSAVQNGGLENNDPYPVRIEPEPEPQPVDQFSLMTVKSRFPSVTDAVITEVLRSTNGDKERAMEELKEMGYEDREDAERRREEERREQERLTREREERKAGQEQIQNRLYFDFSKYCSMATVQRLLERFNWEENDTRTVLNEMKQEKVLGHARSEFPGLNPTIRESIVKSVDFDYDRARRLLQAKVTEEAQMKERSRSKTPSSRPTTAASSSNRPSTAASSTRPASSNPASRPPSTAAGPSKSRGTTPQPPKLGESSKAATGGHKDRNARSRSPRRTPPKYDSKSKSMINVKYDYKTVAIGPNPDLLLRQKVNVNGPDPRNLQFAKFREYAKRTPLTTTL